MLTENKTSLPGLKEKRYQQKKEYHRGPLPNGRIIQTGNLQAHQYDHPDHQQNY